MAKMHRMPNLHRSFSAKEPYKLVALLQIQMCISCDLGCDGVEDGEDA